MQRHCRAAHERRAGELAEAGARSSSSDHAPGSVPELQEEVDRLPERYRAPVVLCYLEGLTQEEAAIRLNLPASTVRVRLMRARSRLRDRLIRRGLTPGALAGLAAGRAETLIPTPLVDETVRAAIRFAAGRAAGASGPIAALAEGVIRAMFLARLKTAAVLLGALTCASLWMISTFAGSAPALVRPAQDRPAAKAPAAAEKPEARPQEKGIEVAVAVVKRAPWERTTTQPGTVKASDTAELFARTPGYLKNLKVAVGSRVKAGEILAEIDAHEVRAAVEKARAEVQRAGARVRKAEAAILVARAAERAEAQSRAAEARITMAEADLAEVQSELRIAEIGLATAEKVEDYTRIQAPFDGVVTWCPYHNGEYVRSPNVETVNPIVRVARVDLMRVAVKVTERDALDLDVGDRVKIWIDVLGPKTVYEGRVARTAYELDPADGTLAVDVDLPNKDGRLRPGQNGRVEIQLESREGLTIPRSAVVSRDQDGTGACFRVVDGRAVQTKIKLGFGDNQRTEVLEGLNEGDRVIARSVGQVSDDIPVTILPE